MKMEAYFRNNTFLTADGKESIVVEGQLDDLLMSTVGITLKCFLRLDESGLISDFESPSIPFLRKLTQNIFSCQSIDDVIVILANDEKNISESIDMFMDFMNRRVAQVEIE